MHNFFFQRLSLVHVAEEEPIHLSKVGCPSVHELIAGCLQHQSSLHSPSQITPGLEVILHLCTNVGCRVSSSLAAQRKCKYDHMNLFICLRMNESTGASHLNSYFDTLFDSLPEES